MKINISKQVYDQLDDASRQQDNELITRTQAGDAAAFDELIVKYSPRLYGLVYHMTSNHEDTHDMMQDIWAKAFRSIGAFRGQSAFGANDSEYRCDMTSHAAPG